MLSFTVLTEGWLQVSKLGCISAVSGRDRGTWLSWVWSGVVPGKQKAPGICTEGTLLSPLSPNIHTNTGHRMDPDGRHPVHLIYHSSQLKDKLLNESMARRTLSLGCRRIL